MACLLKASILLFDDYVLINHLMKNRNTQVNNIVGTSKSPPYSERERIDCVDFYANFMSLKTKFRKTDLQLKIVLPSKYTVSRASSVQFFVIMFNFLFSYS